MQKQSVKLEEKDTRKSSVVVFVNKRQATKVVIVVAKWSRQEFAARLLRGAEDDPGLAMLIVASDMEVHFASTPGARPVRLVLFFR